MPRDLLRGERGKKSFDKFIGFCCVCLLHNICRGFRGLALGKGSSSLHAVTQTVEICRNIHLSGARGATRFWFQVRNTIKELFDSYLSLGTPLDGWLICTSTFRSQKIPTRCLRRTTRIYINIIYLYIV